eukprot:scaffold42984_cov63-Phaeocystis_antarctica.AAC.3
MHCRTMLAKVPPSCCQSPAGSGGSSESGSSSTQRKATTPARVGARLRAAAEAAEVLTASTV